MKFIVILLFLLGLGVGCIPTTISSQTPEQVATELQFSKGTEMTLRETVLGLGGRFVSFFKVEGAERKIIIDTWDPNIRATALWSQKIKKETDVSIAARKIYLEQIASVAVGTKLPPVPDPMYEIITKTGSLQTDQLAEGQEIFLPLFWEDEVLVKKKTNLIWLSARQYKELVSTRKTNINLGLFDSSVSNVVGFTDQIKAIINRFIPGSDASQETQNILEVQADIDWIDYTLLINGKRTIVQAIRAKNAFARYTILANEKNPLILEIILTPASRGSINFFTRAGIGNGFWGYEISSIKI